jgi:Peptidase A4 family
MLSLASMPAFAFATSTVVHPSVIRAGTSTSTNWSGYAVTGAKNSVSDVKGSWVVPAIVGPCPSTNQYSSHWVGIDGFSSNTVEQTGTDSDCQNGAPAYYAWYEFYPHPSYNVKGLTIHPGDHISAEVKFTGRQFTATITDVTTGHTYSTSAKVTSAQRNSAEWITEAPYSGGILPLADFGTIYWGSDYTGIGSTNSATVGGVTGPIGSFVPSSVQVMTMATSGGATKASPSGLSTDGTSFSITWVSAGP